MNRMIADFDDDADGSVSKEEWLKRTEDNFNEAVREIVMNKDK